MIKLATTLIAVVALATGLQAQVSMPQPSPLQTITQAFGLGKIELAYSRPSIKGRKIFGENTELVPLGKPWRTGANAATKITFTDKVSVGGTALDTGSYVLYTIPGSSEWQVVFSKGKAYPGQEGFKESDDVVRVKASAEKTKSSVETLTMQFANVKPESCELQIMWGNVAVSVPITTNIKERLRQQIEEAMRGEKKPYQQAATFYYEYEKDYTRALDCINKAIEANAKGFFLYMIKARIQKDMGDKAGALASANKTIEVATEAKNDDYVRMANLFKEKM